MDQSPFDVPEAKEAQFTPPSVVLRTVPDHPEAYPVEASTGKWTERRALFVPELCLVLFNPPSTVLRITPEFPTEYPVEAPVGKQTERRSAPVPDACAIQPAKTMDGTRTTIEMAVNSPRKRTYALFTASPSSLFR
jgi:hypothetical protein